MAMVFFYEFSCYKLSAVFARKLDSPASVRQVVVHFIGVCELSLKTTFKWAQGPGLWSTLLFVSISFFILESLFAERAGKFHFVKDILQVAIESFIKSLFDACCFAQTTFISGVFLDTSAAEKGVALFT